MFKDFFDESGTHADSAVVVVGSYIASEEQWREFDSEWVLLWRQEAVPAFHRVELENLKRHFAGKNGWDEAHRIRAPQAAHESIRRRTAVGTGGALRQHDYEAVMPPVAKKAFGTAYGWLVLEIDRAIED
jgi:hypothetical protein